MMEARQYPQPIHIIIADDHAVVREGLRTLIGTEPGMEVIGEAAGRGRGRREGARPAPRRDPAGHGDAAQGRAGGDPTRSWPRTPARTSWS